MQEKLNSTSEPPTSIHTDIKFVPANYSYQYRFRKGSRGLPVSQIQYWLISNGYNLGSAGADGYFGKLTEDAVRDFQQKIGLVVDGAVGPQTVFNMGLENDLKVGELVNWFGGGNELVPKNTPFTIIDYYTGTEITVIRTSGSYHADVEPVTSNDSAKYKSLFGYWTWTRRPIIMCVSGRQVAASTHCMPHAGVEKSPAWIIVSNRSAGYGRGTNYDVIKGNGISGHICNHLYKSKGHSSGKQDSAHQKCVQIAAGVQI
jgi:hypothetical protein